MTRVTGKHFEEAFIELGLSKEKAAALAVALDRKAEVSDFHQLDKEIVSVRKDLTHQLREHRSYVDDLRDLPVHVSRTPRAFGLNLHRVAVAATLLVAIAASVTVATT
ncbi:hypothetical protein [Pelagibius sp. Alg239-R121]|uniref:hypothetical protein n=1 Tax=Pelagibius sp. Alg239-R121 TaxID=2993448 RepID=UPI0024A723B9|nr:hypothetical protein [Pelagibius sp. Alg239-R121]